MVHHKGKPEFSSQTKVLGYQFSCFQATNFIEGLDTKTFQIPTAAFQKSLPLQVHVIVVIEIVNFDEEKVEY